MATIVPGDAFAEYEREVKALEKRRDRQMKRLSEHYRKRLRTIEAEFVGMRKAAVEKMQSKGRPT